MSDNPMPHLRRMAMINKASMSAFPNCSCKVIYHSRLYRFVGRNPLISEYCNRHDPKNKKGGTE